MQGRAFIIGLGLIGGSIALSIKKQHPEAVLIGYDINKHQCQIGKKLGVIDEVAHSIEDGVKNADFIMLATPVKETIRIISQLPHMQLKKEVIISDCGSVKQGIVRASKGLKENGYTFIGGHPMAGSHKSGVQAAKELLFENAYYLLTPESHIEIAQKEQLLAWLSGTRAKFLTVSPEEHDYVTGIISHFPHLIAASLVKKVENVSCRHDIIPRLAAGGFRDITRIASSSPIMWRDIFIQNKKVLLKLLQDWQDEMKEISSLLEEGKEDEIYYFFQQAKLFRDQLPQKEQGAIPAFYDLYVDVPDYPGVISEITGYLAREHISITNIRILETREELYGILVITFQTEPDRKRAKECLKNVTKYEIYE
ncbi:prephenate dehydrogenase [Bacillaceae bacterium Marseille-Q3522]|nr:prephenate dehydrogenase [Bacillaceae bacterium Marseille-Q3522]